MIRLESSRSPCARSRLDGASAARGELGESDLCADPPHRISSISVAEQSSGGQVLDSSDYSRLSPLHPGGGNRLSCGRWPLASPASPKSAVHGMLVAPVYHWEKDPA